MNVYDFDDTIFRGDSTRAFWAYCLKRAPGLARFLPRQCAAAVRYALGRTAKEAFKEAFFSFLQGVPDADAWAEDFWRTHERRFRPWYLAQKQPDDLVVSASPEFLLAPACRRLGIRPPIASRVDARTAAVRYALGRTAKEAFKEAFFSFLQGVPDADAWAEDFWRTHERRFRPWYLAQKQPDDLVVSASPEFLLAPACRRLGIRPPIASRVDARTGRYTGLNCKGAEKVSRFREQYPDAEIGQFYSDSRSDAPLAHLARRAFLVRGDSYTSWEV